MQDGQLVGGRWHTHVHHATVGSTNDLALAALADGVAPGLVVTADRQTAGRGRRGRVWEDRPDGASLATSVTVPLPATHTTLLPLVAGLAAAEALARHDVEVGLKWPNDVVVAGSDGARAKLAGILVEAGAHGAVIGIGWNVDLRRTPVPGAVGAADVAGHDVDGAQLFADHLRCLQVRLDQLEHGRTGTLLAAYRQRSTTLGRRVTAHVAGGELVGLATDVREDGALLVRDDTGRDHAVTAGEVVHLR